MTTSLLYGRSLSGKGGCINRTSVMASTFLDARMGPIPVWFMNSQNTNFSKYAILVLSKQWRIDDIVARG
jgi:hypothetical protein